MFLLYYALFYFFIVCLVIFSGRALTIVQQKIAINRAVARSFLTGGGGGEERGIIAIAEGSSLLQHRLINADSISFISE